MKKNQVKTDQGGNGRIDLVLKELFRIEKEMKIGFATQRIVCGK